MRYTAPANTQVATTSVRGRVGDLTFHCVDGTLKSLAHRPTFSALAPAGLHEREPGAQHAEHCGCPNERVLGHAKKELERVRKDWRGDEARIRPSYRLKMCVTHIVQ